MTNRENTKILRLVTACFLNNGITNVITTDQQAEALAEFILEKFMVSINSKRLLGKTTSEITEVITKHLSVSEFVKRVFQERSINTVSADNSPSVAYELVRHYPQLTGHLENHEVSGKDADGVITMLLEKLGLQI